MEIQKTEAEVISFEQLTAANTITLEALLSVLVNKGLINADEVIEKIKNIKEEQKTHLN